MQENTKRKLKIFNIIKDSDENLCKDKDFYLALKILIIFCYFCKVMRQKIAFCR